MSSELISPEIEKELINGLRQEEKTVPCEYCYNDVGSALFQDLCEEQDYYLSRTERRLLSDRRSELMALLHNRDVMELGAGDCSKMIKLAEESPEVEFRYFPNDINSMILKEGTNAYSAKNPGRFVRGIQGNYYDALRKFSDSSSGAKVILFLGSTIGNFDEAQRSKLFLELQSTLKSGDLFILACDLFKSLAVINDAYNGSSRIVKKIELNSLLYLNKRYSGNFKVDNFTHFCAFNHKNMFLESRLFSTIDHHVALQALDVKFELKAGDSIMMDKMWKPTKEKFKSSFDPEIWNTDLDFTDNEQDYMLAVGQMK